MFIKQDPFAVDSIPKLYVYMVNTADTLDSKNIFQYSKFE